MTQTIESISDLIETIAPGRIAELSPSKMDHWLPSIVANTPWSTSLSKHFILLYNADKRVRALDQIAFLTYCERLREEVVAFFRTKGCVATPGAFDRHTTMLVVHTRSPITFGTVIGTDLIFYLLDTDQDPNYMVKFRHEIIHATWGSLYGEAPGLFNEGLAVAVETLSQTGTSESELFAGLSSVEQIPDLGELCKNEIFFHGVTSLYRAAGTLVYFLGEQWGWQRLGQLFQNSYFDDVAIQEKFAAVYGVTLAEVDLLWRDYFRRNYRETI